MGLAQVPSLWYVATVPSWDLHKGSYFSDEAALAMVDDGYWLEDTVLEHWVQGRFAGAFRVRGVPFSEQTLHPIELWRTRGGRLWEARDE